MTIRGPRIIPLKERLSKFSTLDPATGCVNWTGSIRRPERPYGHLMVGSRFRKASDHENAHKIWKLIQGLPVDDWRNVLDFVARCCENKAGFIVAGGK